MIIAFYFNTPQNIGGAYQYSLLFLEALSYIKNNSYIVLNTTHDIPDKFYTYKNFTIVDISEPFRQKETYNNTFLSDIITRLVTLCIQLHLGFITLFLYRLYRKLIISRINSTKADLIVFPLTTMETFGCKIPYILAIHDLQHKVNPQFKELSQHGQSQIRDFRYRDEVKHAFRLLTQSKSGKSDIIRYYHAKSDKIRIVPYVPYLGFSPGKKNIGFQKDIPLPKSYVFYPANYWSHKNHKNLIKAIGILVKQNKNIHVVLTGTKSVEYSIHDELEEEVKKLHIQEYVHNLGYLSQEELAYVYKHAIALVMPTYIGPVNLPIYEAWSLGIPVIASNIRDYQEIAKGAALLVNPYSPKEIADAILVIRRNHNMKKKLVHEGKNIIQLRTVENFAFQLKGIFNEYKKFHHKKIRVSVIIASYNAALTIKSTIKSVVNQTYENLELIVVDGGSTDKTLSILRSVDQKIKFRWISEKDNGIADAFNKGIKMSHGDFIYFLGAGDVLKSPRVIEQMMDGVDPKRNMIVCGKVDRIRNSKKYSVIYTSSLRFSPRMLLYKMGLPHQGMFMNKRFFKTYGLFDIRLKYAMDYELLTRAYHEFPRVALKDIVVAGWREGGVGKSKLYEILDEYHNIRMRNHVAPSWVLRIIHGTVKARYLFANLL